MKQVLASTLLLSLLVTSQVYAQDTKPETEISFNIGAVSDYRYRGISQTRLQPALQGGADFVNNSNGFYMGTWLSTIKWTKDAGGSGSVEADVYLGKRGELSKDISYDFGVLAYLYPSNGLSSVSGFANANTTELYGQLGTGPFTAKYSHSTSNLFGFVDSKGSGYFDLSLNLPLDDGFNLNLHWGKQNIKNNSAYSYSDWKLGVSKEYFGINFGLAAVGTNADEKLYVTPKLKFTGKNALVLSATKAF